MAPVGSKQTLTGAVLGLPQEVRESRTANHDALLLELDKRFLRDQPADGRVLFSANSVHFRSKPLTSGHSASFRDLSACAFVNSSIRCRVSLATSVS